MKHINYLLLLMSVSFLYALLITTNSPLTIQTQSWIYASSSEQEDNNEEETQTSSENEDGPDKTNSESESSQGAADSDQSESNSKGSDDNLSSTNQNSNCPNITEISNLPLYIGQDGCQYPCPSLDSNDENDVPEGCPTEPSSSPQKSTGFSSKEENPTQTPSQEQQQNGQDNPNQNAFVSPSINSDTSTAVSNSDTPTTTTTQKLFTPAGKLRGGPTQTDSSIPLLSNDVSKPKPSDSGNAEVEGTPFVPPSQTESSIPSLPNDPSKQFDPSKPFIHTKPFTSGSQTSSIGGFQDDAHLVVYSNFTKAKSPLIAKYCVSTISSSAIKSLRTEAQANPYCIDADFSGTLHAVQAPGLVEVKVIESNFDTVITDGCKIYIYPKESKSCLLGFVNS